MDLKFHISYTKEEVEFVRQRIIKGDVPHLLYKYRSVESTIRFLNNQSIYFSNFKEFNDPFESAASYIDDFTLQQYYDLFISAGFSLAIATEMTRQIAEGIIDGKACLKEATEHALDSIGYYCLTSKPDNLLMWAHYADSHRGVCLKFDILEDLESFLVPIPVEYSSEYVDFDAMNSNFADLIRRKSKEWEYEQEYRIIKTNFHGLKKVNRAAIKEIIFGCRISEKDKESIIREASKNGFKKIIYSEARMKDHDYGLDIHII